MENDKIFIGMMVADHSGGVGWVIGPDIDFEEDYIVEWSDGFKHGYTEEKIMWFRKYWLDLQNDK